MVVVVVVIIIVLRVRVPPSWIIVASDLLLGLGRLVRGRLESVVPGAWSGIVLRVRVPPSRIVEDHTWLTGPSTGFGL